MILDSIMACKGICRKYKATKPHSEMGGQYKNEQKRCNECDIFIVWNGKRCPCCGMILRLRPRSGKTRIQFMKSNHPTRI